MVVGNVLKVGILDILLRFAKLFFFSITPISFRLLFLQCTFRTTYIATTNTCGSSAQEATD